MGTMIGTIKAKIKANVITVNAGNIIRIKLLSGDQAAVSSLALLFEIFHLGSVQPHAVYPVKAFLQFPVLEI